MPAQGTSAHIEHCVKGTKQLILPGQLAKHSIIEESRLTKVSAKL